ncbi:NADH-quinone oxidoreductase subunit L [Pseudomonas argentinensis]|uniref:NADH-quinone oxidoreductase subunit L n=1 Tax=Phytopseudomonas argentinensis TaxID=289370 RepID=A0A1I3NFQ6_9GAMM|nr:NADH-quinone oxidoreductase subunit L [Pseudomonas argentinensis]KAB0549993.1 NADH-quinone oxidoreductase subunit L [Pseudomonas argentinensis]SFJ08161.1 NADH dehydrogenase subunit L [Pseudomonas argentinensis]
MNLLFLTLLFPLIGWFILAFSRGRLSEGAAAVVGVGSVGLSALTTAWIMWQFNVAPPADGVYTQTLWQWMNVDGLAPSFTLYLDGLSLTMLGVVTGVGFLIHMFASWYMRGEEGYSRFLSYTNLFIFSMLLLVLGDNLMTLFFGWEGVGLCSYLLIGFYYKHVPNGNAALKAFIVTRIGDVFLMIGLFLLFLNLGTLNIQELMVLAPQKYAAGDTWLWLATLMLLGGAVGKSAQLPLQTWLADAMAGPTPVSALIHAATMVTAGVYLIARTNGLFLLTPEILELVGIVGGVTLVLAGFAALVQTDIKRILAYSTMSQIGYMFLALGVGAWDAAIFHLMTHAFFKALLFLASGSVIHACHHEQNIFKMGGLWKKLPLAYASFIVGGSALAALPLITVGFYSKDEILWEAFASGNAGLLYAGLLGAFMTSIYTFRLIFIAFHGEQKIEAHAGHGIAHNLPLLVLIVLSTFIGAWITPPLAGVLPESAGHAGGEAKHSLEIVSGCIALAGILLAALLFLGKRSFVNAVASSAPGRFLSAWWFAAWGFDWFYDKIFVQPYLFLCRVLARDPIDGAIGIVPRLVRGGHGVLSRSETGHLRWYAISIAGGAVLVLAAVMMA